MEFLSLSRRRSSSRNVLSDEEGGETDVFAGYLGACLRSFAALLRVHQNRQLRRLRSSLCTTSLVSFYLMGLLNAFRLRSRDGTTDVTRTWHFGAPTKWERVSRTWVT